MAGAQAGFPAADGDEAAVAYADLAPGFHAAKGFGVAPACVLLEYHAAVRIDELAAAGGEYCEADNHNICDGGPELWVVLARHKAEIAGHEVWILQHPAMGGPGVGSPQLLYGAEDRFPGLGTDGHPVFEHPDHEWCGVEGDRAGDEGEHDGLVDMPVAQLALFQHVFRGVGQLKGIRELHGGASAGGVIRLTLGRWGDRLKEDLESPDRES